MRTRIAVTASIAALALAACGTGANRGGLTRNSYLQTVAIFQEGRPVDLEEMVRQYPALDGRVIKAADYIEEYDRMMSEHAAGYQAAFVYTLQPGTSLQFDVANEGVYNFTVPPTGRLDFPRIGWLNLRDRTIEEVQVEMMERFARIHRTPEIHINIIGSSSVQVDASGAIVSRGGFFGGAPITVMGAAGGSRDSRTFEYSGIETLISLIGQSLQADSEWRAVRVIRRDPLDPLRRSRIIFCDVWSFVVEGDVRQDIPLFPGDVVFVPQRHTIGEQFRQDWDLILSYMGGVLSMNEFRQQFKEGGVFVEN